MTLPPLCKIMMLKLGMVVEDFPHSPLSGKHESIFSNSINHRNKRLLSPLILAGLLQLMACVLYLALFLPDAGSKLWKGQM